MAPDMDLHIQVTCRTAIAAGLATPRQAQPRTIGDARRDGNGNGLGDPDTALAEAGFTRVHDPLPGPAARRADARRQHLAEHAVPHLLDRTRPTARPAGHRAG